MNIIAAVDQNWAIGKTGHPLVAIPEEQSLFREETKGKVVVMGRKTLERQPGGKPLPGRETIVLTRNPDFQVKGAMVCHSIEEALEVLKNYSNEDIFIAGGQSIFEQFLPYCKIAHITYIDYTYEADAYFPNLRQDKDWVLAMSSEEATFFDLCYEFRMYVKKDLMDALD